MKQVGHQVLGEQFYCEVLPCGLEIYVLPKRGFCQKHALLAVGFGAIDRSFAHPVDQRVIQVPDGVAHFLEHRMFEKPEGDISDSFTALGAELNAHTGFTNTAYFFSCTDGFDQSLDLLLDAVLHPYLTPAGVEREREIIAREIQLYSDHLEWVSFFMILRALYREHPLGVDMAGTLESIRQIDCPTLELCYQTFYQPGNMVLCASGDMEAEEVWDRVGARLEKIGFADRYPVASVYRKEGVDALTGPQELFLPIVRPRLYLGFKNQRVGQCGVELLRRELALELALDILFSPSSLFYTRHYESGLIDAESFGYEVYAEPEFGFCLVGGDVECPEQLEELLLAEIQKARCGDMLERGFARAKRKAYGHLVHHLDQVESCVSLMHSAVSRGAQPFDFFAAHERLSPADVRECLDTWLDAEHYGSALVHPTPAGE